MRKRFVIMLLVLLGAVVALILIRALINAEPQHRGRSLRAWFKQYYRTGQWSRDPEDPRHEQAARAMRAMGTNAIPFLVAECFAPYHEFPFQTNVLTFLAGLPDPFRFPPFVPAMSVREEAANAVGEIKPPASLLLSLVTNRLNNPDKFQRWMAVYLLGRIGEGGEAAVPFLSEKLCSSDVQESNLAALGLNRLGPAARSAVPNLIEFVRTNSFHSYYACRALARVGSAASNAVPMLKEKLSGETNASKQVNIAVALICIDNHQREAMAILETVQADTEKTNTRREVIYALNDIGTNARPALPLLLAALNDHDPAVLHPALSVILSLGETNLAISRALEKLQQDDHATRHYAMIFLLDVQPTNAAAMSNLVVELNELIWNISTIKEAAKLGALAQPVIPRLRRIAASKTSPFRDAARKALADIEAETHERESR